MRNPRLGLRCEICTRRKVLSQPSAEISALYIPRICLVRQFAASRCKFRLRAFRHGDPTRRISMRISLTARIAARGLRNSVDHHRETNYNFHSRYRIGTSNISGRPENFTPRNRARLPTKHGQLREMRDREGEEETKNATAPPTFRGVYS